MLQPTYVNRNPPPTTRTFVVSLSLPDYTIVRLILSSPEYTIVTSTDPVDALAEKVKVKIAARTH